MAYNEFIFRILICFALSFFIGIERQYRERPIGLRTSILVCTGSFLYVSFSFLIGSNDVSRIAAQIVTGIGFLGAGVILKDGTKIRGLTTAATLWCVAAIGVLCAGGALKEAAFGTLVILFSNTLLRYINALVMKASDRNKTTAAFELNVICKDSDVNKIKKDIMSFLDVNSAHTEFVSYEANDSLGGKNIKVVINIFKIKSNLINDLEINLNNKYKLSSSKLQKIAEVRHDDDEEL